MTLAACFLFANLRFQKRDTLLLAEPCAETATGVAENFSLTNWVGVWEDWA